MTKAFVLSAGLGTRLRPLTYEKPKALLPVCGQPNILRILTHLRTSGIKEVIINTHHLAAQFKDVLADRVEYSYEDKLLDTGGGLKKVEYFLRDDTFLLYNCDVVTNVSLDKMLGFHKANKNQVTLLASKNHEPKCLRVNKSGLVTDFTVGGGNYAFCGIHLIEPFIFKYISPEEPISIISIYRKILKENIPINIFPLAGAFWQEVGSLASYNKLNQEGIPWEKK